MGLSGSQSLKNGMKCLKRPKVAFHTLLSIQGPFSPTKSVFKVPYPLSFDNRGTKVAEYIHFYGNDFLVFSSDFSPPRVVPWGFEHDPQTDLGITWAIASGYIPEQLCQVIPKSDK